MKNKLLIFLCIGLLSSFIVVFLYFIKIDFLASIDLKLKDARFRLRGSIEPDSRVIIVAIDSKSLDRVGRWPWDRKVISKLIKNINKAKVIALDIVFSETSNPESDRILSNMINMTNTVAGYYFREDETSVNRQSYINLKESRIKILKTSKGIKPLHVIEFPYAELNIPTIKASMGFFNIFPDEDGVYRKINLVILYKGELYPHLALQTISKLKNSPLIVEIAEYGIKSIKIKNETIPVSESGSLTINYYGRTGSFKTVSAIDIIDGKIKIPPDVIVLVGATEIGIADIRNTPFDPVMPGVEISATTVSNILQGRYLIYNAWVAGLDILFIIIPVILLILIFTKIPRTVISLCLFIIVVFFTYIVNFFIFKKYFLDLSLIYPFFSLSMCYVTSEAYRNLMVEKKSKFLKKAFSSYVSPDVVNILIKKPDALKLGGEKRTITVLFSDIRNFAVIAESLQPERLVTLLNNYFDPMTNIVIKHGGMLDKYIGDAIMAVYNAPVNLPEHAKEAVFTALEMLKELKKLNKKFNELRFPEINIGIGINTGEAITGNIGTSTRFDYTAIGDTVNLASRLEELNKLYGTKIIISESSFNAMESSCYSEKMEQNFLIRELDLIRVKGKNKPVKIFEIIEESSSITSAIEDFEKALHLYRKGQFKEAETLFSNIASQFNDKASILFKERCGSYILDPPSSEWDGVFTAKQK
ncbi:CHASE2 domain-containing protein [Thermodesulfovibrio thiophilus]|uniref:CHASE2 domain-containing protein n=1 Tax=Thermodesulfovibrio thiophilus TaxID=340095 RepID=UPI00048C5573|nr:adenylate/guanylate cyclase domain-containing protein [Thermodesulfovibrio thiophilus]